MNHAFPYIFLGVFLAVVIFALDGFTPLGLIAGGVPYVALVLLGLVAGSPAAVWLFAGLSTILTVGGYWLAPTPAPPPFDPLLLHRVLTVFAIWVTALLSYLNLRSARRWAPPLDRDPLTGAYHRPYFLAKVREQIRLAQRYRLPLSLLLVAIERFEAIQDEGGPRAGDQVRQQLAQVLQQHTRQVDTVGGYGDATFGVLLPFVSRNGALATARRIQHTLAEPFPKAPTPRHRFTVHIGVAELSLIEGDLETLLADAEQALSQVQSRREDRE